MTIDTTLTLRTDAPIGTISPRLYGHFAEHLERCCYDGLWVGLGNKDIPNIGGFRTDVVNALKAMPVPGVESIDGFTTTMYDIVKKVVMPAMASVRRCGLATVLVVIGNRCEQNFQKRERV